jgi:PAS domain-containing protein
MAEPDNPLPAADSAAAGMFARLLEVERGVFDGSQLGIVMADPDRWLKYANPAALGIMGVVSHEGLRLDSAFADREAHSTLAEHWDRRRRGLSSAFRAHVTRLNDGQRIPLDILGIPLLDDEGKLVASIGIFHRADDNPLAEDIHRLNGSIPEGRRLLFEVSKCLVKGFGADAAIVTRYSRNGGHANPFFVARLQTDGRLSVEWRKRWMRLNADQQDDVKRNLTTRVIPDLGPFMASGVWRSATEDPLVQAITEEGQKAVLSRPIQRKSEVRGAISLLSRTAGKFTAQECRRINELPLVETVLHVIDSIERNLSDERFELLKELSRCTTVRHACETLARRLVEIYGWASVCLFRVDYADRKIRLLAQFAPKRIDPAILLEPNYVQGIDEGYLGQVVRTHRRLNMEALPDAERNIRSLLCCPISWERDTKPRFLISVGDESDSAFSENEEEWLEEVAGEVGALMERISRLNFLNECFKSVSDPIIVTDQHYEIRQVNQAAATLMCYQDPKDVTGKLADFFEDPAAFERAIGADAVTEEAQLLLKTRNNVAPPVPVHLSSQPLPEQLGGEIFILRDIRDLQKRVELQLLSQATFEVAAQTKAPLSLAIASLQAMARRLSARQRQSMEKALRHLRRVEQGYTRLALFNRSYDPGYEDFGHVNLGAELRAVVADLPEVEKPLVHTIIDDRAPTIRAERFQVAFVIETLLATLIRSAPGEEPVVAEVACDGGRTALKLRGYWTNGGGDTADAVQLGTEIRHTLWLAKPVIDSFTVTHGAMLVPQFHGNGAVSLTLSFPSAAS